jgi:hypothetical protein
MPKKYIIKLKPYERDELEGIVRQHTIAAQKKLRAQVLLACDQGDLGPANTDASIASSLPIGVRAIEHLRERACQDGPMAALTPRASNRVYERKLDGAGEARLVAIAVRRLRKATTTGPAVTSR